MVIIKEKLYERLDKRRYSRILNMQDGNLADENLKEIYYNLLADGRYDSSRFSHSKYKIDFMSIITNADGSKKTYQEYLEYCEHEKEDTGKPEVAPFEYNSWQY